jgi:TolB-like protein
MAAGNAPTDTVRDELERVLASSGFARNERLSRFLRFVVERHLAGHDGELKESIVGIEVFGRPPGFDPKLDSTVRSEATRLRARLLEYYAGEGRMNAVRITLPKGGYIPEWQWLDSSRETAVAAPTRSMTWWVRVRVPLITLALSAALIVGAGWWWTRPPSTAIALAVLPLQNVSGNPADEYLADGLTDELIRNLSLIDGIAPRSRTSSFAFKGKSQPVRDVGRELHAEYILEGSVFRSGDQLRVDAELVSVRDDRPLWSGRFDRHVTDLLAIQDEVARGIVNNLRLQLGRGRRRYETNVEAYDLYLRARALEVGDIRSRSDSVSAFEAVIAQDPVFAPAYAGLAAAHASKSQQFRFSSPEELVSMRAAAEKAVQLDPLLAEAHDALGIALARDAQWARSEQSFRRAIELAPASWEAHHDFAMFTLFPLGRIDEALRHLAIAETGDPLSPRLHFDTSYPLFAVSRFDEAKVHCDKLPADYPSKAVCTSRVLLGQGRTTEAIQALEAEYRQGVAAGSDVRGLLGYAYARAGHRDQAEHFVQTMPPVNPFNVAVIFAGLGDKDRCFEALDRATAAGPYRIGWVLAFPEYAVLRGDSRVHALKKKVGLPQW